MLKGYFHNPFTKIRINHLLSLHQATVYSSLSLHFTYKLNNKKRFIDIIKAFLYNVNL